MDKAKCYRCISELVDMLNDFIVRHKETYGCTDMSKCPLTLFLDQGGTLMEAFSICDVWHRQSNIRQKYREPSGARRRREYRDERYRERGRGREREYEEYGEDIEDDDVLSADDYLDLYGGEYD